MGLPDSSRRPPALPLLPAFWLALTGSAAVAQADLVALRGMMPDEVVLAMEVEQPGEALRSLDAAAGAMPASLPAALQAQIALGVTALAVALGGTPAAFADRIAGKGAVVGLAPAPRGEGWLVAAVPGDLAAARAWCERHADRVHCAAAGDVLLLAPTAARLEALRTQAEAQGRGSPGRWAGVDFGVRPSGAGVALVRGVCDLVSLRRLLGAKAPDLERLDGPARFVLSPFVHALAAGDWLQFGVAAGEQIVVEARADASVRAAPFGGLLAHGAHAAPPPIDTGLAYASLDRSFRSLLRDPGRFLPATDVLAVQGFLSIADALDGAQSSFVDDLLGGLDEPAALYVLPAAAGDGDGPPLVLPGIAIAARIADAAVERILFRFAQVLSTIVNAERAQKGLRPFLMRRRHDETGDGLVAEPRPWRGPGRPPIDSGLSPTLWCGQGWAVLSTTEDAAVRVLAHLAQAGPAGAPARGDVLALHGPAIAAALTQNRAALQLARMLDEGETAAAAERFFDAAIAVAAGLHAVVVRAEIGEADTTLQLTVEVVR
ncbi:MAG TPA: hypothetical protein VFZ65_13440 [Planctomycetota bacterium]|nr:hypothetical protein [Planctomycetota bacterium]